MPNDRRIKVLIIDDSLVSREILSRGVAIDPSIIVVATATDPFDARDKILKYTPDVIICDIEMPKMNGIEFVRRLMPQYPIPVIMVTSISNSVFDAINAGAIDFVVKPNFDSANNVEAFIHKLITKIKIAINAKIKRSFEAKTQKLNERIKPSKKKLVAIGASTGGIEAITSILKGMPINSPGIVITQHIPPVFSRMLAERLNNSLPLTIREAQSGDCIETGTVLIAPGDQHLIVEKKGDKLIVECFVGDKVSGHCPSVDVMFHSVAKTVADTAIGVLLTGMGYDGAKGLLDIRKNGGRTIGQDEASSAVYGMPRVAYSIGAIEKQVSLLEIPQVICSLL